MGLGSKLRASPPVGSKARGKSIEQKVVQYCWATAPEGAQPGTVLREGEQVPGHGALRVGRSDSPWGQSFQRPSVPPHPPLLIPLFPVPSLSLCSLSVLINHLGPPHLSALSSLPDKKQTVSHHHALQAKNP